MLTKGHFALAYGKLERAFGAKENLQRMEVYYEHLQEVLDDLRWRRVVDRLIRSAVSFPRLAEILSQPECSRRDPGRGRDLAVWAEDVCVVRECVDGHILFEEKGYSKIAKCPKCDRLDMELPRYQGVVHLKSAEDVEREIADRRSVVFDSEYRFARGREVVQELIAMASGPRVRTGKPAQALAGIAPAGGNPSGSDSSEKDQAAP